MTALPPLMRDQRKVDDSHLRLLAVFHFVVAGLSVLGLGFLVLHYLLMSTIFAHPETWEQAKNGPPPKQIITLLHWFYGIFAALLIMSGLGNLLSGLFIRQRRHRLFSIIIGAVNCIQIPIGTVLGIFTIIVLSRDSVQEAYSAER